MPNLINKFIEGGTVGTSHSAGLPNITGSVGSANDGATVGTFFSPTGAISTSSSDLYSLASNISRGSTYRKPYLNFNAAASNSIYGNSTTVQPASLEMSYIIKF